VKLFGRKAAEEPDLPVVTVATNSGMLALWRVSAFTDVDGYDAWETRVNDRLPEVVAAGDLVPVGIQSDGAFGVRVLVAPENPTDRENTYTIVTSDPYLLVSDGGSVALSGVEDVGVQDASALTLTLPEGRYAVRASIVAWDEEPGAREPDGSPTASALPDFLIAIDTAGGTESFRTNEVTFDPPE